MSQGSEIPGLVRQVWYSDYRHGVSKLSNNEFHTLPCSISVALFAILLYPFTLHCIALFAIALCPFKIALPCHHGWAQLHSSWLFMIVLVQALIVPLYHPAFTHLHLSISWHSQLCLVFTGAFSLNFPHYQIWPDIGKLQIQRDSLLIGRPKLVTKPAAFSFAVMQVIAQLNWLLCLSTLK